MKYFETITIGADWGLDALIWEHYGYWHYDKKNKKLYSPPDWFKDYLKKVKRELKHFVKPNYALKVEYKNKNDSSYKIWDKANKRVKAWAVNCADFKSKKALKQYAKNRFNEIVRLNVESAKCLLHYKKTGIPTRQNWNTNKMDSYGYKIKNGKVIKAYIPQLQEVLKCKKK